MLIGGLCVLYVPVALNPCRYRVYAYLVVCVRLMAATFWIFIYFIEGPSQYVAPMLFTDLGIGIIQAVALACMVRGPSHSLSNATDLMNSGF
jgi:hypothetical protein